MRNSSLEHRVEMIQNIREISANNERTVNDIHHLVRHTEPNEPDLEKGRSTFLLRLLICLAAFGVFIAVDKGDSRAMQVNSGAVVNTITDSPDVKKILENINEQLTNTVQIE